MPDGQRREFFPKRPLGHYFFDCLYYLLCLREHEPETRAFDHYVWSSASRIRGGGNDVREVAVGLAAPYCAVDRYEMTIRRIDDVLSTYESAGSSSSLGATPMTPRGAEQSRIG